MTPLVRFQVPALAAALALAACQNTADTAMVAPDPPPERAIYGTPLRHEGVETQLLDEGIVNVMVRMSGPVTADDLLAYAECAVAEYAVAQGYGYARHVRTNMEMEGGVRSADAVYTISPTLPRGLQPIDAAATLSECARQGIPTV